MGARRSDLGRRHGSRAKGTSLAQQIEALPAFPPAMRVPRSRQNSLHARATELGIPITTRPLEDGTLGVWRLDGLPWR